MTLARLAELVGEEALDALHRGVARGEHRRARGPRRGRAAANPDRDRVADAESPHLKLDPPAPAARRAEALRRDGGALGERDAATAAPGMGQCEAQPRRDPTAAPAVGHGDGGDVSRGHAGGDREREAARARHRPHAGATERDLATGVDGRGGEAPRLTVARPRRGPVEDRAVRARLGRQLGQGVRPPADALVERHRQPERAEVVEVDQPGPRRRRRQRRRDGGRGTARVHRSLRRVGMRTNARNQDSSA